MDTPRPEPPLNALYQELILDHYRRPRNKGVLEHPTHTVALTNPDLLRDGAVGAPLGTLHIALHFSGAGPDLIRDLIGCVPWWLRAEHTHHSYHLGLYAQFGGYAGDDRAPLCAC